MRCNGRDETVFDIRLTASHTAEYVSAECSVTFSPDRDCEPMRFQSEGFHAFGLSGLRLKKRFIFAIRFNMRTVLQRELYLSCEDFYQFHSISHFFFAFNLKLMIDFRVIRKLPANFSADRCPLSIQR